MEEKQTHWFGRNWLWIVPLSGCLMLILLFVFGVGAAIFGVNKMMKNSEPYDYALTQAQNNEQLIQQLGKPIESNGIMQGNLSFENNSGFADISIPLKGPKGEASVSVNGKKNDGIWTYNELYVVVKPVNDTIYLLDKDLKSF